MSVNIATMGLFKDCCGTLTGGGGAPPYRREDERRVPLIIVQKVEIIDINVPEHKIEVKLIDD